MIDSSAPGAASSGAPGHAADPAPEEPPSRADATVAQASRVLGGAWGTHAGRGIWWTPLRIILALTAFTLILGYLQKAPCADGNWGSHGRQYTHACYSDVIPLWGAEGLDTGAVPYRDTAVEYPVLTGGFMWISAELTRGLSSIVTSLPDIQLFGIVTCILLALCGLLTAAGTAGAAGRRPYDATLFALSPLLIFHAFSNWDLLAMALTSCALWAWSRSRPVAAGALLGLGTAAKLYPVFILLPLLILAIRTRRYREFWWATISAAVVWFTVNGPIALAYPHNWWEFYKFSEQRSAEASTFWYMGHYLVTTGFFGDGSPAGWVPPGIAVALAFVVGLGAVAYLGLLAPVKPRLGQLAFLVVLAFLLTTKVWSPQYSLWLVPLLALARPRWRLALIWQFSEIAVWIGTLWWLEDSYDASRSLDYGWLMLLLLTRDALLLVIAGLVVRDMWRPELDVVRAGGLDDPAGGPFDDAPDLWQPPDLWRARPVPHDPSYDRPAGPFAVHGPGAGSPGAGSPGAGGPGGERSVWQPPELPPGWGDPPATQR